MTYVRRDSRNVLKHLSGIWFYFASGIILASIIAAIIALLRGKPERQVREASEEEPDDDDSPKRLAFQERTFATKSLR